jgi:protein-serine/threonine kinase
MPLEQIRPSFQLYQPGRPRDDRQIGGSMPFEYDGDEEEEADEVDQPIKMTTRPQDMNLLKLGGVGGVTRSGSWGQNLSNREKTRETFLSSLTQSPVQVADAIEDEEADSAGNMARSHSMILNQQRKVVIDHSRSFSSDLPVLSKETAASYSAAAFSLRSLSSHRSSMSSASSSGATSSISHHTASCSPTPASETDSMGTKTSRRMSQAVSASTSSGSTTGTAQGTDFFQPETVDRSQIVSPPSSVDNHQVGPGVNRILSIGRGYRKTGAPYLVPPDLSPASQPKSPISPADSVGSNDNNNELLKALTLSAAAATPELSSSLQSTSTFTPPAPRRHTGAYALRSQSALSQSGGALGPSWGGSGGRAAAREMAQNSKSHDNAPFSQLEARRAMEIASSSQSALLPPTRSDRETTRDRISSASSSDNFGKRKAPRMSEGLTASRPTPLDTLAANVPLSTSLSSLNTMGLGIDTEAIAASRPDLPRTNTVTNVLRTPTTEEWSRFRVKQGLDPASVAAGKTGRSNRTSLNHRKNLADRMAAINTTSSPSMNADFVAAALTQHQDAMRPTESDMPLVGDSEEEESEQESVQESVGRRAISRSSSSQIDLSIYDEDPDSDGETGSSSFERMQALHEAISRPPSRRGSPPPLLDFEHMAAFEAIMKPAEEHQRIRRLTRESSFAIMGYPPSPIGERRNIDDFVILSDIGRGAYGLVKRVQLKDPETGKGYGPEFCIKYIIKSRILADCWRRHKILGPIPIEIHVMDQLRRLHYKPSSSKSPWSVDTLLGQKQEQQLSEDGQQPIENVGHPSLCKMLDFFEDHEFYYMVMPCFGKGQDLFDYIESQPHGLSSLQVRCIFGQVADGIQFLHQNNIVHRDIKDENVILDGNGHAQIIDFGSAAHVNKNGRLFDTFSGTLDYAAAEILKGEKYAGKEQDVWALGVVGYVLLCGDCPFWNGQEAIQGMQFNTRAYQVLQERCRAIPSLPMSPEQGLQDEVEKRESDRLGQLDGGGKIDDAADLIQRCLELEIAMRPSMDIVCQHRFLIGNRGWSGPGGWRQMRDAASSSSTSAPSE